MYVIYSPRHLVLALALESSSERKSSILVIHDGFSGAKKFYDILIKNDSTPFFKIYFYSSNEYKKLNKSFLYSVSETKFKLRFHENIVNENTLFSIVTPMVNDVLCQFLVKRKKLDCEYLEDGLFSYIETSPPSFNNLKLFLRKLKYGFWYQKPQETGAAKWVSSSWFLNPELASRKIKLKPIKIINKNYTDTLFFSSFIALAYEAFNTSKKLMRQLDYLIILDVLSDVEKRNPKHRQQLQRYLTNKKEKGKTVGLKLHPRDMNVHNFKDAIIIPSGLPAEFLIPKLNSQTTLIGDYSTVMIDAKNIDNKINVLVVNNGERKLEFKHFFERLNIPVYENFGSLMNG